ncbi:MAG: signal peptidase II [Candidatus Neomarinimicrobiota bacterium]
MLALSMILALVVFDQWTKYYIVSNFNLYQSKPIIENFFHLTYITNDGMAFGLSFPGGKQVLLIMTVILTFFIIIFLWKERKGHPLIKYGLVFILSGAFGNLIDRFLNGKVVDFLDFMVGDFHWYVFNIADSSVTIGMILFISHSILYNKEEIKKHKTL